MSREQDNKAIVGRWFDGFWGNPWNPKIIDELAAPDILLQYSLHAPRRGRDDVRKFMVGFREAFPDLNFWGAADLIAEGDYVVGRWEGGGTHTGPAFSDFLVGSLPAASGRREVPVHVHCIANYRVSAFFYRYRRDVLGMDESRARAEMEEVWHPAGVWASFVGR
jgi:hypothetical protein